MYLGLALIFPIKFHPDPSTLSVFQDFRFPPSNSPQCHQTQSGFKIRALRHNIIPTVVVVSLRPGRHLYSLRPGRHPGIHSFLNWYMMK